MKIMEVLIQDFFGENKFVLKVEPQWTFENVKAKMQEMKGIPAYMCDIYHKDTLLENETTVGGFNLEFGSELLFILNFEKFKAKEQALLQVNLFQKLSFLDQLTQNMTRYCSLYYPKNASIQHVVYKYCF